MAEVAKLNDLPQYAIGLADGNYSTGPDYAAGRRNKPLAKECRREKSSPSRWTRPRAKSFPASMALSNVPYRFTFPASMFPARPLHSLYRAMRMVLRKQLPTILDNMIADHRLPTNGCRHDCQRRHRQSQL